MEKYIQQFSNTILNLFFDQSNYLTNKIEINSDSQLHYVKEAKKEQSLLVQIFLNSKNPSFNRKHQIMLLEISHQNKTSNYEGFQQFDDFINDDPQNLQQNLNMVLKLIISMSFLSPYINFSNNKYSQKITLIRKKYIMDYSVSYQQNFETMKEKKLKTQNTDNVYSIKKVIENSKEIILVNYQIADNLNEIVQLIQQNEVLKSKSSKGLRNRFLSEETGYEIYENNLRKVRAAQRFRSSLSIKQIDKKTHLLSQILINKKPYELVDEVILKNTLNEQNENEASLFIRHPNEVEFDLKSPEETNNSSSFFTDTNFSIRSKNKEQSVQKTDLNDFDQIPTTENIYYIFKETGKAFRKFQFQQNNEKQKQDQTYTCKGNKRKQIVFRFGNQKALNFDFYVLNFFSINQQFKMRRVVQQNIADLSFYEQCQNTTKLDSQKFTDIKVNFDDKLDCCNDNKRLQMNDNQQNKINVQQVTKQQTLEPSVIQENCFQSSKNKNKVSQKHKKISKLNKQNFTKNNSLDLSFYNILYRKILEKETLDNDQIKQNYEKCATKNLNFRFTNKSCFKFLMNRDKPFVSVNLRKFNQFIYNQLKY